MGRTKREPCPVCGEISYSLEGIHPQCAQRQADQTRMNHLKAARLAEPPAVTAPISPRRTRIGNPIKLR